MDYEGVLIEESLADRGVLASLLILNTAAEPVADIDQTPWLKQWTMHLVSIPETKAEEFAQRISQALEGRHPWYADFKNERWHFVVFRGRIFKVDRNSPSEYEAVKDYGRSLGIPEHQLDFSSDVV